jgi:hypothetical protein
MVSLQPLSVGWDGVKEASRGPIRLNISVTLLSLSGEVLNQAVEDWWEDYWVFEAEAT